MWRFPSFYPELRSVKVVDSQVHINTLLWLLLRNTTEDISIMQNAKNKRFR